MTYDFTSFSTVFQSYQADEWLIMINHQLPRNIQERPTSQLSDSQGFKTFRCERVLDFIVNVDNITYVMIT